MHKFHTPVGPLLHLKELKHLMCAILTRLDMTCTYLFLTVTGYLDGEEKIWYGPQCNIQQTFSRASRDESYSSPSRVWQPQSWIVEDKANSTDMESTIRSLEFMPLRLVFNELLNPIDDGRNRFIELFSPNKKNYAIKEDIYLVRNSADGDIFEMNLRGKEINGNNQMVFCLDNSERFNTGTWSDKCDYKLDNTVESVVMNMTMLDRFELLVPVTKKEEEAPERRLQSTTGYSPVDSVGNENEKTGHLFYNYYMSSDGRRIQEFTQCPDPEAWGITLTFNPLGTSEDADPNDGPLLPLPTKAPSSFPTKLPSQSPSILPSKSVEPSLGPSITPSTSFNPSDIPSHSPTKDTCNLIITELGVPDDIVDAVFVELFSDNCNDTVIDSNFKLVSGTDKSALLAAPGIDLNPLKIGSDGFLVLCTDAAKEQFGEKCDHIVDALDRDIKNKATAIVRFDVGDTNEIHDIYGEKLRNMIGCNVDHKLYVTNR